MKPYSKEFTGVVKGISSRRKSLSSPHRIRCLRVDKKSARKKAKIDIDNEVRLC